VVSVALTPKQERFVQEYLVDLNATQAAIRAEYSEKTAYSQGQRLLKNVEIQAAIQNATQKRQQRVEITQDRVLLEYARLAFFDPRKLFCEDGKPKDISELDDDTAAALAGLDMQEVYEGAGQDREFVGYVKKYKLANKLGALDSLGKHLGMFSDKPQQERQPENSDNLYEAIAKAVEL
jgi:phage terminase small subunit